MQVLMRCHIFITAEILGKIPYKPLKFFTFFLSIKTVDPYFTVTLFQDTANYSHQSSFAGTVGSKKTEHPVSDVDRNAAQRFKRLFLFTDQRDRGNDLINSLSDSFAPALKPVDINVFFIHFNSPLI